MARKGEHWYVSIQTEREFEEPFHPSTSAVGIDLGTSRFVTLSDGSYKEPLNSFKKLKKKLAKAQRRLDAGQRFGELGHS